MSDWMDFGYLKVSFGFDKCKVDGLAIASRFKNPEDFGRFVSRMDKEGFMERTSIIFDECVNGNVDLVLFHEKDNELTISCDEKQIIAKMKEGTAYIVPANLDEVTMKEVVKSVSNHLALMYDKVDIDYLQKFDGRPIYGKEGSTVIVVELDKAKENGTEEVEGKDMGE